jgi:hypothetical protein
MTLKNYFKKELLPNLPKRIAQASPKPILTHSLTPTPFVVLLDSSQKKYEPLAKKITLQLFPAEMNFEFIYSTDWDQRLHHVQYLIVMGAQLSKKILKTEDKISQLQGQLFEHDLYGTVIPLYAPEFIDLNPHIKRMTWDGIKAIKSKLSL